MSFVVNELLHYGHARVAELVVGGATRSVLSQMTVPLLISH